MTAKNKKKRKKSEEQTSPVPLSMADAFEKGVVLYVKMGAPGFISRIDTDNVDAGDVDPDMLRVSKRTLDCAQYKAMKSVHGQIKKFLRARSLPVPRYMKSAYFIPDDRVDETFRQLEQYVDLHDDEYLPAFIKVYQEEKERAKVRLTKKLYDESDYPSVEKLRRSCYIKPEIIEIGTPKKLESINPALYRAQREALREKMAETARDMQMFLRSTLLDLVGHLREKLAASDPETGRPMVIRKSAVENIEDFLQFFESRNVTGDRDLAELVEKLRKSMAGLDLDTVKHDEKYREGMATAIGALAKDLGALVTSAPRKIRLPKAG